jgi:Ca-activated chloride channel homolog
MHFLQMRRCQVLRLFLGSTALLTIILFPAYGQLPLMNTGSDYGMSQIDMTEIYLDTMNRQVRAGEHQQAQDKALVDSGLVSVLDLGAPRRAVEQFNRANTLMKAQKSKEAMKELQKAIADYPKFVSAHVGLGLACIDQEDTVCAKNEFETAAKLDDKFPGSFLRLGELALSKNDFAGAQAALQHAAFLCPKDTNILLRLAFAQHGAHEYRHSLQTAGQVHALEHKGRANVHYVAASSALALNDFDTMERELAFFVDEDPTNALAPLARQNLTALGHNRLVRTAARQPQTTTIAGASINARPQSFPNTARLKAELSALGDETDSESCEDCSTLAEANPNEINGSNGAVSEIPNRLPVSSGPWTIRKNVDQVALFLAVSNHGRMVNDLQQSDVKILDDNKAPESVVQFAPQSKVPLRLALLVDTSGSVQDRFSFEKHAAAKFVEKMLSNPSDLGFIEGFSHEVTVTQDFTSEPAELGKGIEKLTNGGGTALFDAVTLACQKLAAYPEREQVARVLVILSDGEDNSSHGSLKQSIRDAERTGVTIYTVSTREAMGDKTDADKVLEALADRSGGEAMFPGNIRSLSTSFDKLREVIRNRYFIAYKPADFLPNGNYRTINIVAMKDGKRLQIRARKGYHARMDASHN